MQLSNALVIAPEEGGEILRQVVFVYFCQRADDTEVQGNIASKSRLRRADLDVAGMHVCMEKSVTKHLGEENSHTIT